MSKKQYIYNQIMLGAMVFGLLLMACVGVYSLLVRLNGGCQTFVPVIAVIIWCGLIVERVKWLK